MEQQGGYAALVEALYRQYADDVLRVSYFYLGDKASAEDVTQEVFMRLLTRQPVLNEGSEKSWLLKVALNICRDRWRSAWARRVVLGSKKLEIMPADEDSIESRMEKEALMQAVHALPAATKEVFLLHYFQGMTIDQIALMLDAPPGTIASRLSRGRQRLKTMLEEEASR